MNTHSIFLKETRVEAAQNLWMRSIFINYTLTKLWSWNDKIMLKLSFFSSGHLYLSLCLTSTFLLPHSFLHLPHPLSYSVSQLLLSAPQTVRIRCALFLSMVFFFCFCGFYWNDCDIARSNLIGWQLCQVSSFIWLN